MTPHPIPLPELSRNPLVSVVLANYNYGHFLAEAVQSVLNQTYTNWELIICDDGSTDHSVAIARVFESADPRISVLVKENAGQVSAWNLAYHQCQGQLICFLDSDDAFFPEKLEKIVQALREAPEAGLVYHRYQFADERLTPLDEVAPNVLPSGWLMERALRNGGEAFVPKTSDFAVRREVMDRLVPLPEGLGFADGYICRTATFLTAIAAIPDPLSYYRIHGQNAMGTIDLLNERRLQALARLLESTFQHQRAFLSASFGEQFAVQLRLEDLSVYWDILGRLYLLEGQPGSGVTGMDRQLLLENLGRTRKRHMWRLLFAAPHPLSLWLLRLQISAFEAVKRVRTYIGKGSNLHQSAVSKQ